MPSSITFGLCVMFSTMLLIFAEQGSPQCYWPKQCQGPQPNCCPTASKAVIRQPVISCYEQKANTFANCQIHAYIFVTDAGKYCVDPNAQWFEKRLQKLKERGIVCKILGDDFKIKRS